MKRKDYISWDEYFLQTAELCSKRSKDPNTRHGACIVKNNKIISTGYNGLVNGLNDDGHDVLDGLPTTLIPNEGLVYDYWLRENKEHFVIHAEANAILNAKQDVSGSSLYLHSDKNYLPCSNCAKMIVQSGIVEVVVRKIIQTNTDVYNWDYTNHIFIRGGVTIRNLDKI